ncbi:SAM-dependent methyltransferase [Paramagnetospirillum magnetotacticum MS-1]|uniref:SAM-dependent methyltransferase n=1 Tax=Paramagnetospirillum magnetotacticum MS-1 TaxID=272627 RepID=A0A0C2YVP9_PARME|nr:50S ribosomal protein L11 methyltransferase [Paramagnetospirillum magnetotacticum]KIL99178.1 SAM-dependent methyltransferase [Paramagnetospirillum magnetotacticum MS-1]
MTPVSASYEAASAFIQANTEVASPPACPEIKLWTATEVTPLWEATEEALLRVNLPPPYWAFCWAGGQALTRWVLDHPEMVEGKRVLDFAAGSGVTALAAAKLGAAKVEAAEIDPMACYAIRANAELNGVQVDVLADDVVGSPCRWDVVMAGDVCYEAPMTAHIWPWLVSLAAEGAMVVMADPGRAYLPKTGLLRVGHYTVITSLDLEDKAQRDVGIYKIVG